MSDIRGGNREGGFGGLTPLFGGLKHLFSGGMTMPFSKKTGGGEETKKTVLSPNSLEKGTVLIKRALFRQKEHFPRKKAFPSSKRHFFPTTFLQKKGTFLI